MIFMPLIRNKKNIECLVLIWLWADFILIIWHCTDVHQCADLSERIHIVLLNYQTPNLKGIFKNSVPILPLQSMDSTEIKDWLEHSWTCPSITRKHSWVLIRNLQQHVSVSLDSDTLCNYWFVTIFLSQRSQQGSDPSHRDENPWHSYGRLTSPSSLSTPVPLSPPLPPSVFHLR